MEVQFSHPPPLQTTPIFPCNAASEGQGQHEGGTEGLLCDRGLPHLVHMQIFMMRFSPLWVSATASFAELYVHILIFQVQKKVIIWNTQLDNGFLIIM